MAEQKTRAREVAIIVLLGYASMIAIAFYQADQAGRMALINNLWVPVTTLVGGAFSLKAVKHIKGTGKAATPVKDALEGDLG